VPYECIGEDDETHDIVHTEVMAINPNFDSKCSFVLVDCKEKNNPGFFINDNTEIQYPNEESIIEYGEHIYKDSNDNIEILKSKNSRYKLILKNDGNLVIKLHSQVIWENKMNYFVDHPVRLRINEKGHLVKEAKDLFKDTLQDYRRDEWITVWSSAPINHNVTIGIPNFNGKIYKLILSDTGSLNMYDSVGTLIWCSDKTCKHRLGYKFPEFYLVPTDFVTPEDKDAHNKLNQKINFIKDSFMMSLDYNFNSCHTLNSINHSGIISNNKRFKLILEENGNLIIKDNTRTMWESSSGNKKRYNV